MPASDLALAYVRIPADSPEASASFAETRLGLRRAEVQGESVLLRADHQAYRVAFIPRHGGDESIGIELADATALDAATTALAGAGFATRPASAAECRQRQVRAAILTRDASGNAIDLVLSPNRSAQRFFPAIDSGVTGLANIGLRSVEIERDTEFWIGALGARVTDRAGEITYLGLDAAHHRIVLHPSDRAGILYICLAIESIDYLMQSRHLLAAHQVRILQGPGRQAASGQVFLHTQGPDGMIYSLGYGMIEIDPLNHRPRQFADDNVSLCSWGSVCDAVPELYFGPSQLPESRPLAGRTES